MTYIHVDTPDAAGELKHTLSSASRIALDCEAAGFHRYDNRLCLVQLTAGDETYVVDPFAVDVAALLGDALHRSDVPIVMHGADFDLRLLGGELGLRVNGLFDTQIAASLLGVESLGLAALLEARFGVKLSKKHQRADWAERPLSDEMLEYAANDTRYLLELADQLTAELESAGRTEWSEQECRALETVADNAGPPDEPEDPVIRVKGARDLSTHQVAALREALMWRDEIARARDRAAFRVVGDGPLLDAVARHPKRVDELVEIKGFPGNLARSEGEELLKRLHAVTLAPEDDLEPYPRATSRGAGRPPPEVEEVVNRLKDVRNRKAEELGLPRGTLLSNAVLLQIATDAPSSLDALGSIDGMRPWRVELLGRELLDVLQA
ncbi:MAG: HRDC domain-containing protein [Gemmatimonadota bacterium]|nr:HRDC domain-containing protein [Gemmatimonadota bacterium]